MIVNVLLITCGQTIHGTLHFSWCSVAPAHCKHLWEPVHEAVGIEPASVYLSKPPWDIYADCEQLGDKQVDHFPRVYCIAMIINSYVREKFVRVCPKQVCYAF